MMKNIFSGRRLAVLWALSFATLPLPASAQTPIAQGKAIRIIVPFGAGGIADLTARLVGQKLSEHTVRCAKRLYAYFNIGIF